MPWTTVNGGNYLKDIEQQPQKTELVSECVFRIVLNKGPLNGLLFC